MNALRHLFWKPRVENKSEVEHGRLIGAAEFGNFNRIESLLSEGANVNFCNLDGETALTQSRHVQQRSMLVASYSFRS